VDDRTVHALNVVRGIAALLVVLSHSRDYLFEAFDAATPSGWQEIPLAPTGLANEAVSVFFVLSGYLVGGQVVRQVREGRFSWRDYLAKRLSRMWVVLLPALLLTLVADSVSRGLFGSKADLIHSPGNLELASAACNAVFLQSTRCLAYGSNDALWSLSFEFWFYILCAGATVAMFSAARKSWARFAVGAVVSLGAVAVFGWPIFRLIFTWAVGVVVAIVHAHWTATATPPWVFSRGALIGCLSAAAMGVGASSLAIESYEGRFAVVGLAVAPLILVLAAGKRYSQVWVQKVGRSGDWSFSVYAYHLPILKLLIVATASLVTINEALLISAVYVLGAAVTGACIPLWAVTEKRTPVVREAMLSLLGSSGRAWPVRLRRTGR
jgi:peptidoglycan/LPS O-acetylase OafA/YrhL